MAKEETEISDTKWTTSIYSEADVSQKKKPPLIQGPWTQGHVSVGRVQVTDEDSRKICHKIDRSVLIILVWVYFLQSLDKTVVGYSAVLGLQDDLHLVGNQFYWVVSIALIAQITWLPFSSFLILKIRPRSLLSIILFGWGIAQACTPAAYNFGGLLAVRFMLGIFEASCLPLFALMTGAWYRRAEQPLRIAAWYGTSGLATIVTAVLSYGFGRIQSPHLAPWKIIFLSTGLLTILTVPFIYWKLEDDVQTAAFLMEGEQAMAIERLRANQAGSDSREVRWSQIPETLRDFKTSLFFVMSLGNSLGSQVLYTFGPMVLNRLGYDKYTTLLLNIPFGTLQYIIVLGASWLAMKFRWKSLTLGSTLVPVITGLVILFALPRDSSNTAVLLIGYHLLSFIFGCNTLILSWLLANTAGQTKKSVTLSFYSAASSTGSILGPLLFKASDAPQYDLGLKITLGVYIAIFWAVIIQVVNLVLLNRAQEKMRVEHEKPARLHDHSMEEAHVDITDRNEHYIGNFAFADLTDRQNNEFVYVY
ncbi:hypothetical protein diail_2915 [Diaporthe ilicicola]|nr:hypothetical protein diail_2915 [Diaporthe ilicicola]